MLLSWDGSTPGLQLSSAGILRSWHLLTSWGFQGNVGFLITASPNGLSGSPRRDTSDTCLASVVFLNHGGGFYNSFLVSLTLKPKPVAGTANFCSWMGLELTPVQFTSTSSFCCRWFPSELRLLFNSFSQFKTVAEWGLALRSPLPFIPFSITFL